MIGNALMYRGFLGVNHIAAAYIMEYKPHLKDKIPFYRFLTNGFIVLVNAGVVFMIVGDIYLW